MTDSFRRIDYSVRPAKYAERKMLCDVFRRLAAFEPLKEYRYVGFGSVWFSDFLLMHRALGIKHMLSIEQAVASQDRFLENRPFNIDMDFRPSTDVLPDMGYDRRQFIWLDYDDPIQPAMLQDVASIASRARSGTVLAVSVQSHRAPQIAEADRERQDDETALTAEERFLTLFDGFGVDPGLTREDLSGWSFGTLSRQMLVNEIDRAIEVRRLAGEITPVARRTICEFEYEDGAKMTTLVVAFYSDDEEPRLNACHFQDIDFLNDDGSPVYIPTPKLTVREFRQLESQLPLSPGDALNLGHIPKGEANGFVQMYRYFPSFAVIET